MMPGLGPKKKEILPKMDRNPKDFPQLSNEMQLSIMNKVKNGELSIEDALKQARMDTMQMHKEKSQAEEEQYNFSVHKHTHYRWQKRVLQIDFKTKMLCNIEKGIVKRQFPFSTVRSCDDAPGSKFSISFSGHHDYELEATSVEDKQKMIQLVNKIIYRNIYSDPEEDNTETCQQPEASQSLREGVLLLHRGGLASFRWVKYEVRLHPGQLVLVPLKQTRPSDVEVTPAEPVSIVIHLSDGDTSVQKPLSTDAFTLITHKNKYQFRVPIPDQTTPSGDLRNERDAWVEAIDKLCLEWRRKSKAKDLLVERKSLQNITVAEETENTNTDLESNGGSGVGNTSPVHPSVNYENADPAPGGGHHRSAGDTSTSPPSAETKPIPRRRTGRAAVRSVLPPVSPPTSPVVSSSSSPLPPSPELTPVISSTTVPESPPPEIVSSVVKVPSLPSIPPPPPLPCKLKNSMKAQTKAFHWDVVGSEKIEKSFWKQESSRRIEIDKSRLFQQFVVKDQGKPGVASHAQQIMLNEKIAHNFNIFLKSFPLQPGELKDKLFIVSEEEGGLSDEHITSLRRYVPTLEDIEMYKSHKGPVTELHIVDQYMMEMCNIPCLSTQLDLLLTLRELPITMNDLQPLINQKIRMCTELNNSRSFVAVLEYLLAIGNYLNENTRKGKAKGIRLSSLAKLSQLRGRDKKFTLLHALVEQIMLHEPCLATFTQELAEFETVPGASIKGLTAEVDVLKNELQKIVQYTKKSKRVEHQKFFKDLKAANEKYNTDLSLLTKTCEEMKKLYSAILVKFGEPVDQDSQELFGLICQFIHDFKRARAEMI